MKIKLTRDAVAPRECSAEEAKKLKKGTTHELDDTSAWRWVRRGAAEEVTGTTSTAKEAKQ